MFYFIESYEHVDLFNASWSSTVTVGASLLWNERPEGVEFTESAALFKTLPQTGF